MSKMHWMTRYVYLLYWYLRSQGMSDNDIAVETGISHQTIVKLKSHDYGYFQSKTIEPLEAVVIDIMEEQYGTELRDPVSLLTGYDPDRA